MKIHWTILAIALTSTASCAGGEPIAHTGGSLAAVPIRVAAQNEFYTQELSCGAVGASVVSLGGGFFLQVGSVTPKYPDGMTFEDFLAQTEDDVACRLGQFLEHHPGRNMEGGGPQGFDSEPRPELCGGQCPTKCRISRDTRTIVIDIENPHLKNLHTFGTDWQSPERVAVVNAFRTRVAAAKAVFPAAKLGLYGTLVPDGRGRSDDPTYQASKNALYMAARYQGLLAHTEYLVPVLYVRFGCDDESASTCPACDASWETLAAMTELGIDGSREIDPQRPLLPLLGFGVNNAKSCFHRKLLLDLKLDDPFQATLGKQIELLRAKAKPQGGLGGPIDSIVLWAGSNTPALPNAETGEPWENPNGLGAKDYTDFLCNP